MLIMVITNILTTAPSNPPQMSVIFGNVQDFEANPSFKLHLCVACPFFSTEPEYDFSSLPDPGVKLMTARKPHML